MHGKGKNEEVCSWVGTAEKPYMNEKCTCLLKKRLDGKDSDFLGCYSDGP